MMKKITATSCTTVDCDLPDVQEVSRRYRCLILRNVEGETM